jgi:hypothetical protein
MSMGQQRSLKLPLHNMALGLPETCIRFDGDEGFQSDDSIPLPRGSSVVGDDQKIRSIL